MAFTITGPTTLDGYGLAATGMGGTAQSSLVTVGPATVVPPARVLGALAACFIVDENANPVSIVASGVTITEDPDGTQNVYGYAQLTEGDLFTFSLTVPYAH